MRSVGALARSSIQRLLNVLRPGRVQRQIDRELLFHIGEHTDALVAQGVDPDEAARRARRQFGNVTLHTERTRDADVALWLDGAARNLRLALRMLARTPGFTISVVLTLALGIGANSAVFSAIDAVLLRPLPFPDADRLVHVTQTQEGSETTIAPVRLEDWNRLNSTFEAIAGYFTDDVVDTTGDLPERVRRAVVTPRFLDVWGMAPALGRGFTDAEHRFGGPNVVLISDRIWRSRGTDPAVLERPIRTAGLSVSVAGVMPPLWFPDRDVDVWGPMPVDAPFAQSRRIGFYPAGIGRLKAGVTLEQARADLTVVQAQLREQYPDSDRGIAVRLVPLKEKVVGGTRASLWLLFGAVTVLLLIACTNIAALLLSRATQRKHEIAIRYSLGASRAAVVAQTLTETGVLALAGAGLGLFVAAGAAGALRVIAPNLPRLDEVAIDSRILLYTVASAVVVALLCGLVPAFRSAGGGGSLSHSSRTHVSSRHSLQWLLVGVQVALSVTLLAGAGLLVRSVNALSRVDPGFDPTRILTFHVTGRFGEDGGNYGRVVERINHTLDELAALPGIEAAATASLLPAVLGQRQETFELLEGRAATAPPMLAESRIVSPSYFSTMQVPLLAGELCRRPATAEGQTEVMVNRVFADRYLQGRPVVGLHLTGTSPDRIVGVVGNARELSTDRDPVPTVYGCFSASTPTPWFLVRTSGEPMAAARAVRLKLKELEPLRPVYDIAPLEARIGDAYAQNRLRTVLLTLFAMTALGLVCAGVYGTLSYAVNVRRREVALRLALGARRRVVVQELIGASVRIVAAACACGLALALIFTRSLSTMLYGVSPSDPATLAGVVAVVVTVSAVAALVPAARAAFVEPMRALREE